MTKYLILLLAFSLTLLSSCGGDDDGNGNGDGDAIRIGVIAPLTGGLESYGVGTRNAVELAVKEINAAGGINGQTVQVIVEDTGLDTALAAAGAARLIADGCVGIIGAVSSGVSIHVSQNQTAPNNIPQISGASTSPQISGLSDNNMLWRTCLSDIFAGAGLANYCFSDLNHNNVAILNIDNSFGNGIANQFDESFRNLGGVVHSNENYPDLGGDYTGYSFASAVETLFAEKPPAVVVIGYGADGQNILDEVQKWIAENDPNYDPVIFCSDSWQTGAITDNVPFSILDNVVGTFNSPPNDEASAFYQNYQTEYGSAPTPYVSNTYDAAIALLLAIEAADATDGASIVAQLSQIAQGGTTYEYSQLADLIAAINNGEDVDYQGASGPIGFDGNGDLTRGIVQLWRFVDNQGSIESETVASVEAGQ